MTRLIIFILFSGITAGGIAQKLDASPYSHFGTGNQIEPVNTFSALMGGADGGYSGSSVLNFSNPAALSGLKNTVFDMGAFYGYLNSSDFSAAQKVTLSGLGYLSMGFPLSKKMGFSASLQPASNMGYKIQIEQPGEVETFVGDGGTSVFSVRAGYELYQGISLGVEGNYYFGNVEYSIIDSRDEVYYSTHYRTLSYLSGYSFGAGLLYRKMYKEKNYISAGAKLKFEDRLKAESEEYLYSSRIFGTLEEPHDTLTSRTGIESEIIRPLKYALYLGAGKTGNWYAGIGYESQDAWQFGDIVVPDNDKVEYTGSYAVRAGGFWIPKINSLTSYWSRVKYSAGVKYVHTGLSIATPGTQGAFQDVNKFGISFGLGLPAGTRNSQIQLGFEYENRGKNSGGLIQEQFYNLRIGVNISEKWFRKRKID